MILGMRRPQVMLSQPIELLASVGGNEYTMKAQSNDLGPLPLVRLRYDSDWADDERDTALTLLECDSHERGYGRSIGMILGHELYVGMREHSGKDLVANNKEGGQDGLWRSPMSSQQDRDI
ncbi:hypothetical protein GUJ93_ZPchr0003g17158 [Zizania palustris]|uniref:Uncharacterized protein n=1 Tax=Zizania palustris TaxID=103762 RepID=A0A8J5SWH5_ZIZPA|nr:hypothetical protein GUJ93_ZPchr0003g17158 [Zizania palustris]